MCHQLMRSRQSGKDQLDFFVLNPLLSLLLTCSPLSNDVFIIQFSDYSENSTEGCKYSTDTCGSCIAHTLLKEKMV